MTTTTQRERMRAVIEQWRRSGQAGVVFARENGLSYDQFRYWKHRLAPETVKRRGPVERRSPRLLPVRVVDLAESVRTATGALEVLLASGDRLLMTEAVSVETLRRVVTVLRQAC